MVLVVSRDLPELLERMARTDFQASLAPPALRVILVLLASRVLVVSTDLQGLRVPVDLKGLWALRVTRASPDPKAQSALSAPSLSKCAATGLEDG